MSFGKNLFVFVSGAVVGAGALAGFAGWQMYKALKKNDVLYTAVRSSVDAGVKAASSEFSEHGAKAIINKVFGWSAPSYPKFELKNVYFDSRNQAAGALAALKDFIDQVSCASVGDLYDYAELPTNDYTVNHYGWKNLDDAYVFQVRDGHSVKWSISLPDPIKLE